MCNIWLFLVVEAAVVQVLAAQVVVVERVVFQPTPPI
jgi:hypothetical protein